MNDTLFRDLVRLLIGFAGRRAPGNLRNDPNRSCLFSPGGWLGSRDADLPQAGVVLAITGAKAQFPFFGSCGTAKQVAEKGLVSGETPEKHPSGPKGLIDLVPLTARLKSCPDTRHHGEGVFPQAVKPCPDTERLFVGAARFARGIPLLPQTSNRRFVGSARRAIVADCATNLVHDDGGKK